MNGVVTVLYEDDDLLVINKPAGLVCHPTKGDALSSLISRLRLYRGEAPVFLVNRLDRETSGVTLAAKSAAAAGELGRRFGARAVTKEYLAVVHGHPLASGWEIDAPLGRDETSGVAIKDQVRPDGVPARTRVAVLRRFSRQGRPFSLMQVEPLTGRKHQIRLHLAHSGHPIVGDKIYGGDPLRYLRFVEGRQTEADRAALLLDHQALHASSLSLEWQGRQHRFEAPAEPWFFAFLQEAGGQEAIPPSASCEP